MAVTLALVAVCGFTVSIANAQTADTSQNESGTDVVAESAGRQALTSSDLLAAAPDDLTRLLEIARPSPVSAEQKARILVALPKKGQVAKVDSISRPKLLALTPLLQIAKRESVYVIMVIDVPQAVIALHARTVILISQMALTLLSPAELRALVAHEIGHEYVWAEYERASHLPDDTRLQDLELVCDILAIVALRGLGHDGSGLISGIEKLLRFNRERFGPADNGRGYPSFARRRAVARAVEARALQISNGVQLSRGRRRDLPTLDASNGR